MTKSDMRIELDAMIGTVSSILDRLKVLRYEMHNRSPADGRRPSVSKRISPQMRQSIREMRAMFPDMTMTQIAHAHGLNSEGRVSEIIAGKRT